MNPNKYYVYVYLDPYKRGNFNYGSYIFDFEPFYIGKGSGKRFSMHLFKYYCFNNFLSHKINKIKNTNNTPIIIQYQNNLTEEEAYNLEYDMIKSIGRRDLNTGPLTNLTDGGIGGKHRVYTNEQRELRRKMFSGSSNPMFGKKYSKEQREFLSKTRTGSLNSNAKEYKITDINKNVIIIKSLKTFCKENNLNYSTIRSAMQTKRWHSGYFFEEF